MSERINTVLAELLSRTTARARSRDVPGQGLVEYALIIVLVAIVAMGALSAFGSSGNNLYMRIVQALPF